MTETMMNPPQRPGTPSPAKQAPKRPAELASDQEIFDAWKASGAKLPTKPLARVLAISEEFEKAVDAQCLKDVGVLAKTRQEFAEKFSMPAKAAEEIISGVAFEAIRSWRYIEHREAATKILQQAAEPAKVLYAAIAGALEKFTDDLIDTKREEHQAAEIAREKSERAAFDAGARQRVRAGQSHVQFSFHPRPFTEPEIVAKLRATVEAARGASYVASYGNRATQILGERLKLIFDFEAQKAATP